MRTRPVIVAVGLGEHELSLWWWDWANTQCHCGGGTVRTRSDSFADCEQSLRCGPAQPWPPPLQLERGVWMYVGVWGGGGTPPTGCVPEGWGASVDSVLCACRVVIKNP
eukprot:gene11169-biopygen7793